jgi:hypothetical protein
VFPAPTKSGHIEPSTIQKKHRKAVAASGVTPFVALLASPQFLTRLGETGCDVWTLARIAGHAKISMSEPYVHPSDDAVQRAFGRLGDGNVSDLSQGNLVKLEAESLFRTPVHNLSPAQG